MELYKPVKSTRKFKKYMVKTPNGIIHFGDTRYEHFKDKIGLYSSLDHNDPERRELYYKRHGERNITDKNRAKYWSHKILW